MDQLIDSITVKRRGDVRKAKLYHLRELSGKAARIKEKVNIKANTAKNQAVEAKTETKASAPVEQPKETEAKAEPKKSEE